MAPREGPFYSTSEEQSEGDSLPGRGAVVVAPPTGPLGSLGRKVLKDTAMLNGAALASQAAALLQSLVVMRLLQPQTYGVWLAATIVLSYGGYAHFGGEHALELRLPYF